MFRWQSFTFFSYLFIHFQQFVFLFLCSFYIAFWGCLDLFYLRFIKNFQIIWEEFSFFFTVFHNAFDLRGIRYSTEPGRQALTGSGGLRYAAKILYEIMLAGFLCLTKPAFMRRPWRITPCPAVLGWAFLCFVGIISTVSRQLRYSPSRACVCLPPGFLTLWLYLPSCRFARSPPGSLCACLLFFYAFPSAVAVGSLRPSPASHRVSS